MVLCVIAFIVFSIMSIFSAKYRPLAKKGFECVWKTFTLKPCDTGLDDEIKASIVFSALKVHPKLAKFTSRNFVLLSWLLVILSIASFILTIQAIWNLITVGTCDPANPSGCVVNQLKDDYGSFGGLSGIIDGIINPPSPPPTLNGITSGSSNATVTVVEFGCFTCPYTGSADPTVKQILTEYGNRIYYVFKPFPIPSHANSYDAARAVLCARNQNKHWELQSEIFGHQQACVADGNLALKNLANQSGLNMTQFNNCFENNETNSELNEYIKEGQLSHIKQTPTFFINNKTYAGNITISQFRLAIDEALAR